jgi:hypothetical protein
VIEGEEEVNKVIFLTKQVAPKEAERIDELENLLKSWNLSKTAWFTDMQVKDQVPKLKKVGAK